MPDITMCKPIRCQLKDTCYRYKADPNPIWQSYFVNEPYDKETKKCDYYYETKSTTENTKSNELLL
jgi:hypothetical protein